MRAMEVHRELGDETPNGVAIGLPLGFLILFVCCYLMKPRIPDARFHRGEQWREESRLRREAREARKKRLERLSDPELRAKLIDESLVTQTVLKADASGTLTLGDTTDVEAGEQMVEVEETEDAATCVICLEPFQVRDEVSWGKKNAGECLHVFHKECICAWLTNPKHEDCPSCRLSILIDPESDESEASSRNLGGAVFMVMNGLLSRVRDVFGGNDVDEPKAPPAPSAIRRVLSLDRRSARSNGMRRRISLSGRPMPSPSALRRVVSADPSIAQAPPLPLKQDVLTDHKNDGSPGIKKNTIASILRKATPMRRTNSYDIVRNTSSTDTEFSGDAGLPPLPLYRSSSGLRGIPIRRVSSTASRGSMRSIGSIEEEEELVLRPSDRFGRSHDDWSERSEDDLRIVETSAEE